VKKVQSILEMTEPKNTKQLRGFIGLINYYRDMWHRRSHVLAPLTELCSKKAKFVWGDKERKAFQEAKRIISKNAMLAFPDFTKKFDIYTDASKYQLGAVIMQEGKPLAFYSRKLKDAQTRYTTTERELLSIVETLKEFRNILLGHELEVFTDHKNLIYHDLTTERVLRWRLLMEEYNMKITYIQGTKNIVADVLSRYPTNNNPEVESQIPTKTEMSELFATGNDFPTNANPLSFKVFSTFQQRDLTIQDLFNKDPNRTHMSRRLFHGGEQLVCYDGKIYVPPPLRNHVVTWYHEYLCHPGETRTEETIRQHLWWPNLRASVRKHVDKCTACQRGKKKRLKYGLLPPKEAEFKPWQHLCVDTIGPYRIRRKGKKELMFQAVTFIDPATGWFEMKECKTKKADEVANLLEQAWLNRYPWPEYITFDNGPEFKAEFLDALRNDYSGIKMKPSSKRNPQANAILERAHGTIGNMIRTFDVDNIDLEDNDPFAGLVSAVCFAIRSTYHTTLQATPGQLVFGRDMIFPIEHIADWQLIKNRKQIMIDRNNAKENLKRIDYDYRAGEKVLIFTPDPNKMEQPREGPYEIVQVHTNGTVTLQKGPVTQRYNVRQIVPFRE
jgi:transposase InsO family protein